MPKAKATQEETSITKNNQPNSSHSPKSQAGQANSASQTSQASQASSDRFLAFEPVNQDLSVIGAGAWGTTLAIQTALQGLKVKLWARRPEVASRLKLDRENRALLPGHKFPLALTVTSDPAEAVSGSALIIWVVPSHAFREVVRVIIPHAHPKAVHISASKGIEAETFSTMTDILASETTGSQCLVGA
ncbi:MAG: NAD(P)-binding domain-containing protein, partial [Deltaproteobacteria bacterium]|nr:NAD(P)-binding domain-containing protein [Deltaproteobacteria bacterium]